MIEIGQKAKNHLQKLTDLQNECEAFVFNTILHILVIFTSHPKYNQAKPHQRHDQRFNPLYQPANRIIQRNIKVSQCGVNIISYIRVRNIPHL